LFAVGVKSHVQACMQKGAQERESYAPAVSYLKSLHLHAELAAESVDLFSQRIHTVRKQPSKVRGQFVRFIMSVHVSFFLFSLPLH
jgi:hypothetical protein